MALTQDSKEARMKALTRLALATREKVDAATYVLYVEDTAHFPSAVVVDACRRIETSSPWFPKLAELVEECRLVAKYQEDQREEVERKRLPPAPISDEKWKEIQKQFHEVLGRKVMP